MRVLKAFWPCGLVLLLTACGAPSAPNPADPSPHEQVLAAEHAFANSMARRDFDAFRRYVDDEAVFFDSKATLHGRKQVLDAWQPYFTDVQAPFSWEPDAVEVLASGQLALSTGPVRDATGKTIARFNSIWRRNAKGEWKVVFDKGSPLEAPAASPAQ